MELDTTNVYLHHILPKIKLSVLGRVASLNKGWLEDTSKVSFWRRIAELTVPLKHDDAIIEQTFFQIYEKHRFIEMYRSKYGKAPQINDKIFELITAKYHTKLRSWIRYVQLTSLSDSYRRFTPIISEPIIQIYKEGNSLLVLTRSYSLYWYLPLVTNTETGHIVDYSNVKIFKNIAKISNSVYKDERMYALGTDGSILKLWRGSQRCIKVPYKEKVVDISVSHRSPLSNEYYTILLITSSGRAVVTDDSFKNFYDLSMSASIPLPEVSMPYPFIKGIIKLDLDTPLPLFAVNLEHSITLLGVDGSLTWGSIAPTSMVRSK